VLYAYSIGCEDDATPSKTDDSSHTKVKSTGLTQNRRPLPLQEAYPIFWAVKGNESAAFDANGSVDVTHWGIKPNNWTRVGGLPLDAWPTLDKDMTPTNGGVPQAENFNLSLFQAKLGMEIQRNIPDPEWSGLASFDFEAWAPIWEENTGWAGKPVLGPYQNYSVQIVRAAHPTWSADKIEQQAKAEFEAAATALFVAALNHASALRPKALFGFYGMPRGAIGSRADPTAAKARALADARTMLQVWQASGALFPSTYLGDAPAPDPVRKHRLTQTVEVAVAVAEMVRATEGTARRMPVYPFAWECYEHHTANNDSSPFLTHTDAVIELLSPYDAGADGLIVWGATIEAQGGAHWSTYVDYIKSSTGPLIQGYQRKIAACSTAHCSGHGRCSAVDPADSTPANSAPVECECFDGFSGPACLSRRVKTDDEAPVFSRPPFADFHAVTPLKADDDIVAAPPRRVGDIISFGAVSNDNNDDTAAIQRALDACAVTGSAFVPAGTYKISLPNHTDVRVVDTCLVMPSNCTLHGEGDTSILKWDSQVNNEDWWRMIGVALEPGAAGRQSIENVAIRDLHIDGSTTHTAYPCFGADGEALCEHNAGMFFYVHPPHTIRNVTVQRVLVEAVAGDCMAFADGVQGLLVEDVVVRDFLRQGVDLAGNELSRNFVIRNVTEIPWQIVKFPGGSTIHIEEAGGLGNVLLEKSVVNHSILAGGVNNLTIRDNIVHGCILGNGNTNLTVVRNTIIDNGEGNPVLLSQGFVQTANISSNWLVAKAVPPNAERTRAFIGHIYPVGISVWGQIHDPYAGMAKYTYYPTSINLTIENNVFIGNLSGPNWEHHPQFHISAQALSSFRAVNLNGVDGVVIRGNSFEAGNTSENLCACCTVVESDPATRCANITLKTDDAAVPPLFLDGRDLGVRRDDGLDEYDDTKALAAVTSSPSLLSPPPKPLLCPCADQALCKSLSPQPPNHAGRDEVFAFSSWSFNGEQARSGWTAPQNLDWSKITAFAPFDDLSATSYGGGFSRGR
jgi:hypothetical protein